MKLIKMKATTMEEAIAKATIPERAYCYHVNIASRKEGRLVGIEIAPSQFYIKDVNGFYIHTNHFIQPGMTGFSVENVNSVSRLEVLENLSADYSLNPDDVKGDLLTGFLSSHDQWINSPCSHATVDNDILQTLGSTLFDVNNGSWRIAFNNPCEKKFQIIAF